MPAALVGVRVAPGKRVATFSALAFCPLPYSTTVVAWLVLGAVVVLVTVNPEALRASEALPAMPVVRVPL